MTNHPRSPINACPKHGETGNEPCLMCFPLMPKKDESPMEYSKRKYEGALKALSEQDAPTLTCSEVVERLALDCMVVEDVEWNGDTYPAMRLDRVKAEKVLHSWRERRVQALEEALRPFARFVEEIERDESDDMHATFFHVRFGDVRKAAKVLESDEWREQIRKGANHESA